MSTTSTFPLDSHDIADAITGSAAHCAKEHRAQGWEGDGSTYAIGAFPGDVEDLEALLSRKATREEIRDLERAIRAKLSA